MAVLKYRSTDGTIKTLPIIANGNGSGTIPAEVMATIDQHTEDIAGLETQAQQLTTAVGAINDSLPTKYSAINPPPYPVAQQRDVFIPWSIDEKTLNVELNPFDSLILQGISGSLPAGNTTSIMLKISGISSAQFMWRSLVFCGNNNIHVSQTTYVDYAVTLQIKNIGSSSIDMSSLSNFIGWKYLGGATITVAGIGRDI